MTKFENGPAHGKVLALNSAPALLRVTVDGKGNVDALNDPNDEPRADEKLYTYRLTSDQGGAFVDGRDKKTGKRFGGFQKIATYTFDEVQPSDDIMRDKEKWIAWNCGAIKGSKKSND